MKWERERKWHNRTLWLLLPIFLILAIRVCCEIPGMDDPITTMIPQLYSPSTIPETLLNRIIIFIILLVYASIPMLMRYYQFKYQVGPLSKKACVYLSLIAATALERDDPITASLSIKKLLIAISDLVKQDFRLKEVSLAPSKFISPSKYMQVTSDTIPKKAVFRAIQDSRDNNEFQEQLRDLAIELHKNENLSYIIIHRFLYWLNHSVKRYRKISQSFLDKRPNLKVILIKVVPVVLTTSSAIIVAFYE